MFNVPRNSPSVDPDPRSAHLKRSWTACHAALFPDPTFPTREWELDVAGYLWERGYGPESIRLVLDHAATLGSVECCPELQFCSSDRDHVEGLLPEMSAGAWARYDGFVWEIGGPDGAQA